MIQEAFGEDVKLDGPEEKGKTMEVNDEDSAHIEKVAQSTVNVA